MISIVMAARNYAKFLPMAVRSVLAQTVSDWELVIVDDGSSDDTPHVVKQFSDVRIHYYRTDRLGQSRAKNLGVRLTQGEYIAFLDADDAWLPEKLERQRDVLTDERIQVVATARTTIDESTFHHFPRMSPASSRCCHNTGLKPVTPLKAIEFDDIFIRNPICFSSTMLRRSAFDRAGGFDELLDLSIDYDLWLRIAKFTRIVCLYEPLTLYRTGHGNLSAKQCDRIATAFTIMNRHASATSHTACAEAYAMTHQSLGWLNRRPQPLTALRNYGNSLRYPALRWLALKGLAASALNSLKARRPLLSAANDPANR